MLLSDGAAWIRSLKEELFPDAQQILDFFHLCENTHAFAKFLYKTDESMAKSWAKEICDQLEDGKHEDVLKSRPVGLNHQLCWWSGLALPGLVVVPPEGGLANRSFCYWGRLKWISNYETIEICMNFYLSSNLSKY